MKTKYIALLTLLFSLSVQATTLLNSDEEAVNYSCAIEYRETSVDRDSVFLYTDLYVPVRGQRTISLDHLPHGWSGTGSKSYPGGEISFWAYRRVNSPGLTRARIAVGTPALATGNDMYVEASGDSNSVDLDSQVGKNLRASAQFAYFHNAHSVRQRVDVSVLLECRVARN